jgi:hypothetical protein
MSELDLVIEASEHPETLLTRKQAAAALQALGFPISPSTLATKASRPTPCAGPPYRKFGTRPLYRLSDLLTWAEARLGPAVTSTSEAEVNGWARTGVDHPAKAAPEGATQALTKRVAEAAARPSRGTASPLRLGSSTSRDN